MKLARDTFGTPQSRARDARQQKLEELRQRSILGALTGPGGQPALGGAPGTTGGAPDGAPAGAGFMGVAPEEQRRRLQNLAVLAPKLATSLQKTIANQDAQEAAEVKALAVKGARAAEVIRRAGTRAPEGQKLQAMRGALLSSASEKKARGESPEAELEMMKMTLPQLQVRLDALGLATKELDKLFPDQFRPILDEQGREIAQENIATGERKAAPKSPIPVPVAGRDVPLSGPVLDQKIAVAQAGRPQNVGTIPPGFRLEETEGGAMQMVPIPGSKAAREAAKAVREEQVAETTKEKRRATEVRGAELVVDNIDRVFDLVEGASLPTTGTIGNLLSDIGETNAGKINAALLPVRANIGFNRLQEMRESSPTGGALGNITEGEVRRLEATAGNVEQSQDKAEFLFNMSRLQNQFLDIIHGPGNGPPRRDERGNLIKPKTEVPSGFTIKIIK